MIDEVFVVFEEQKVSCDADNVDGFVVVWDSEELGRNLTTCELIEKVGEQSDEVYQKLISYIERELELNYAEHNEELNNNYFDEVFEFLEDEIGGGIFYKYEYQISSIIRVICASEEEAKEQVNYYKNCRSYDNDFRYERYNLEKGR